MDAPARHAIAITLTALLALLLLHGERMASELDERGFPSVMSALVRTLGDLSPNRIFSALHTATGDMAAFDRRIGGAAADDADDDGAMTAGGASLAGPPPLWPGHIIGATRPRLFAISHGAPSPVKPVRELAPPVAKEAAEAGPSGPAASAGKKGRSIFDKALSRRYKVLLVGDSFMEDLVLALMRDFYYRDPNVEFVNAARHSTGLCISTKWDWPKKLAGLVDKHRPDVVLIFIGANDLQNIYDGRRRYSFTSPAWQKHYVEIAGHFLDVAASGKADVLWIGLPVMGKEPYLTWMPLLTRMQREACASRNVEYIDTGPTLADANGNYQAYMTDSKGNLVRLRKDDRYHVAYEGCLMIIRQILPSLRKRIQDREDRYASTHADNRKQ